MKKEREKERKKERQKERKKERKEKDIERKKQTNKQPTKQTNIHHMANIAIDSIYEVAGCLSIGIVTIDLVCHSKVQDQGHAHSSVNISHVITDTTNIIIANKF